MIGRPVRHKNELIPCYERQHSFDLISDHRCAYCNRTYGDVYGGYGLEASLVTASIVNAAETEDEV